jgi:hypothetical protein
MSFGFECIQGFDVECSIQGLDVQHLGRPARGEIFKTLKMTLSGLGHLLQCTDDFGLINGFGPMTFE